MSLYDRHVDEMERVLFPKVLSECNGCVSMASSRLGINRGTFRKKLAHLGIDARTYKTRRSTYRQQPKKKELVTPPGWRRELAILQGREK